jgi:hypothetical protein
VAFLSRAALARQMNAWQLLPRPEPLTELYFTDYSQLPATLKSGSPQQLSFTVHNLEHQTTRYSYRLSVASPDNGIERLLGAGAFTLAHDHNRIITQAITIPPLGTHLAVKVSLEYQGTIFGNTTPGWQTQSIHYLITLAGSDADVKGNHVTT